MVYHAKDEVKTTTIAPSTIKLILFLSKMLTSAGKNYWPTKYKVAYLVWTVRETRHMIEAAEQPTVVFTDHISSTNISKQNILSSLSTTWLNLRLVCASQYLQQFTLNICHKPGKMNKVPNALSRLTTKNEHVNSNRHQDEALEDIYV
jgi:hypothetical protein